MNWVSWLALIGAGAWIPHVLYFIYKIVSKPSLKFIPEPTIEIGYTSFGPILNPSFAISSSRKDALIEKLKIEIIHEPTNEKHEFTWQFLEEKGFQGTSSKGEMVEMRKSQSATALKIGIVGLVEKKIFFQDVSFLQDKIEIDNLLAEQEEYLKKANPENYVEDTIKSKQFIDLLEFLKKNFYWKEGRYVFYLYVYEITLKKPHVENFSFHLSKTEVDRLERNIEIARNFQKYTIQFKAGQADLSPFFWNWVNPKIERINN